MDLAIPYGAMPAWGDREIGRFLFRAGLFQRRGQSPDMAERLADRLALRDHQRDDRRLCLECSNLQRSGTCFKKQPVSPAQLARCASFEWQMP